MSYEDIKFEYSAENNGGRFWIPVVGEVTESLLSRIFQDDTDAKDKVKHEACQILRLCGDPEEESNNDTGLVFGYVQSGKTLSFTTLTALARDNGYQLVIIIAGTSTNLVEQSSKRLVKDLNLNSGFRREWVMLVNPHNPNKNPQARTTVKTELEQWKSINAPRHLKKTVLITVMKQSQHLNNLNELLKQIDLRNVPTLIIDDEGDQASLNTKAMANSKKNLRHDGLSDLDMSTIYSRIRELKASLPHHTFLQYTATPQAPLFINLVDNLSPNFISLLTPGEKYTGGLAFFKENAFIVRQIPDNEIYSEDNPFTDAPESLLEAMRIFFLGVMAGIIKGEENGNPRNRSMMVHPSRSVEDHGIYANWVKSVKNQWAKILIERSKGDESRVALVSSFADSYADLEESVKDLPPFDDLLKELGFYIRSTAVKELNSKAGSSVDWNHTYSHILVGGQAMDRGFTVEGLTVTYMPRSKGVGNADTLQQRARFFGYKRDYLGFCRVYLDVENIHLFSEYVEHEEDIRNRLEPYSTGEHVHLNNFQRRVVLDEMFKLTRKNVLSNELSRNKFGNKWVRIRAPHDNEIIIQENRETFDSFIVKYEDKLVEDEGHPNRTEDQKHLVMTLGIKELYDEFLSMLKYTRPSDAQLFINLKGMIELYNEGFPPERCHVYVIKKGEIRQRGLNRSGEITNLFQGKNPKEGEVIYPGDEKIRDEDHLTVQIHNLAIKETGLTGVIGIAVWVPERLSKSIISISNHA